MVAGSKVVEEEAEAAEVDVEVGEDSAVVVVGAVAVVDIEVVMIGTAAIAPTNIRHLQEITAT